ncbi:MAG: hypothetical protein OER04_11025, partial [Cyclobacteriaceae bacterium]|nr:hypothetical protein [Cyclobacteriaceae bacterium]
GTHSLELTYFKEAEWMPPRLALSVSTSKTYPTDLHDFDSYPPSEDPVADILVHTGNEVKLLRAFLDYQGDQNQRLTHTIGVSEPCGLNYVYDLARGNLVCVWRGDFVDATPMWHNRGDGSFRPLGGTQYIMNAQPIFLAAESSDPQLKSTGYQLEEQNGRPIFTYSYGTHKIKDRLYPDETNTFVTREITVEKPTAGLFFKIAQGSDIISLGDGQYVVDDKSFYIKMHLGEAEIRDGQTIKELVAPLNDQSLVYSIIW